VPVVIRLHGGDVIHSFWVPQLAGKTDAIPGQQNITWLEADRPGVFRGQCAEYCGAEHAKMGFEVVAQSMADFQRWRLTQLQGAMPPGTPAQQRGYALTIGQCGRCHAIRGTAASARTGPDLTHLMSRRTLAAAMLINNPGSLAGWIEDPQSAKPGALMPAQPLSGPQLNDVTTYLETLK
jgi:cytochrome c oxidase subunit 2